MRIRNTLIIIGLLVVALPIGTFYFLQQNPASAYTLAALAVVTPVAPVGEGTAAPASAAPTLNTANLQYLVVARGDVRAVVSAVGKVEADETIDISFTSGGRVAEIFVKPMDYVEAGHLLMQLENDTQRTSYNLAMLNLELAQIELADLQGPVDADDVRIAEANVDAAYANYQSAGSSASRASIQSAQLQITQSEAAVQNARERRIYGGDFSTEEEVLIADAGIVEAETNLEIARQNLNDLQTGNPNSANAAYQSYLQSQAELERVLAGPRPIEIEQAQVRVEQAQAAFERAEANLRKTEIYAPVTGYVTEVPLELGALISAGGRALQMVDVEPLSIKVQIDEIDIRSIQPGTRAIVEIDAIDGLRLDATVLSIALLGTPTSGGIVNYDAEIQLLESDPRVRVGMTAQADMIVEERSDVTVLPNNYIRVDRRQNRAFVNLVDENNTITEVEVSLGLRGEETSEVISGVAEGDIIAADLTGTQFSLFGG
ncbi:MAG: efflux RND transporter periplasmic adaptor subunit [Phototrophicaceae bacterium]|jgi:RND family efflux transporter MFP subunit